MCSNPPMWIWVWLRWEWELRVFQWAYFQQHKTLMSLKLYSLQHYHKKVVPHMNISHECFYYYRIATLQIAEQHWRKTRWTVRWINCFISENILDKLCTGIPPSASSIKKPSVLLCTHTELLTWVVTKSNHVIITIIISLGVKNEYRPPFAFCCKDELEPSTSSQTKSKRLWGSWVFMNNKQNDTNLQYNPCS